MDWLFKICQSHLAKGRKSARRALIWAAFGMLHRSKITRNIIEPIWLYLFVLTWNWHPYNEIRNKTKTEEAA
jgi:hypothetical protein